MKLSKFSWSWGVILAALLLLALPAARGGEPGPYDRTESDSCKACHFSPGKEQHAFIDATWIESSHANSWSESNGNTYCMQCHAPFQADPDATHDENEPVPIEESQAITCGVCHPPHDLRIEWETPIGNYDIALPDPETGEPGYWFPVYEENELCEYCHSGSRHARAWLLPMEEVGVRCVDCHMPKMPILLDDGSFKMKRSHFFDWPLDDEEALFQKAYWSCGTDGIGCHADEDTEWAVEVILSGIIHVPGKLETEAILAFFEEALVEGTLSGRTRLRFIRAESEQRMRSLLEDAALAFSVADQAAGLALLQEASLRCDGKRKPADYVQGEATLELNTMIVDLILELTAP